MEAECNTAPQPSYDALAVTGNRPSIRAAPADGDVPAGSGEVVLVVEDDPSLRRMVAAQLQSLGYSIVEAEDACAALKALECKREIDLLLTDIVISGGMNGVQLGDVARGLRPDMKLMYMSAYPGAALEASTPLDRDVLLLRKPFRRREIAAAVKQALDAT